MASPLVGWAVTATAHGDCAECMNHAMNAANHALATGSVGATYGYGINGHSATVTRAYGMVFTGVASADEIEWV